ncbi:uncharacterized protein LOC125504598, partial [Dendroctonus ponderosae]|uniref:uncharacterized protein LOC125504598 n=1 Tax=Dendroctonus ponderosae TaxID=77166 RepID=UPI002034AB79
MWPTLSAIYLFLTGIPLIISNDRSSSENFKATETGLLGGFEGFSETRSNANLSGPISDDNCAKSVGKCALSVASLTPTEPFRAASDETFTPSSHSIIGESINASEASASNAAIHMATTAAQEPALQLNLANKFLVQPEVLAGKISLLKKEIVRNVDNYRSETSTRETEKLIDDVLPSKAPSIPPLLSVKAAGVADNCTKSSSTTETMDGFSTTSFSASTSTDLITPNYEISQESSLAATTFAMAILNESTGNGSINKISQEIHWPVKKEAIVEGDIILGGLMMVHERSDSITCGPVMPQGGIQALEAMLFTLDQLNSSPEPLLPNITLGAHILDD